MTIQPFIRAARWIGRWLFGGAKPLEPPRDPSGSVRVLNRRGPVGRGTAAAVEEPDEPISVGAVGSAPHAVPMEKLRGLAEKIASRF